MNKPPVLSYEETIIRISHKSSNKYSLFSYPDHREAQRDADVEWFAERVKGMVMESLDTMFADIKNPDTEIYKKLLGHIEDALQQAKQETAREILEIIDRHLIELDGSYILLPDEWDRLKSQYLPKEEK